MREKLARFLLEKAGWHIRCEVKPPPQCVVCMAPHTSNWDFVLGMLLSHALGRRTSFLMKKEWFRFPLGPLMRAFGGIPVDRSRHTSLTDQIAERFAHCPDFIVAITPEGTRNLNTSWRHGFIAIAHKAQVPILLAYIDYGKREVGCAQLFWPTGSTDNDMAVVKSFYRGITAKYPEKFGI